MVKTEEGTSGQGMEGDQRGQSSRDSSQLGFTSMAKRAPFSSLLPPLSIGAT